MGGGRKFAACRLPVSLLLMQPPVPHPCRLWKIWGILRPTWAGIKAGELEAVGMLLIAALRIFELKLQASRTPHHRQLPIERLPVGSSAV